jgi:hypothetical protein
MSREQIEKQAIEEMALVLEDYGCMRQFQAEIASRMLYAKGYRKQSDLTPCDVCRFNPPSSTDGKPCLVCPAQAKMKGGAE